MASCVRNIGTKNYQNLIIGFQVTVKNVGDVFWDTVYFDSKLNWQQARKQKLFQLGGLELR